MEQVKEEETACKDESWGSWGPAPLRGGCGMGGTTPPNGGKGRIEAKGSQPEWCWGEQQEYGSAWAKALTKAPPVKLCSNLKSSWALALPHTLGQAQRARRARVQPRRLPPRRLDQVSAEPELEAVLEELSALPSNVPGSHHRTLGSSTSKDKANMFTSAGRSV